MLELLSAKLTRQEFSNSIDKQDKYFLLSTKVDLSSNPVSSVCYEFTQLRREKFTSPNACVGRMVLRSKKCPQSRVLTIA